MPQLVAVVICSLFLLAWMNARRRAGGLAAIHTGETTLPQARAMLGRPAAQVLQADGSVALRWARSPIFRCRRSGADHSLQIRFDRCGIATQVDRLD